MKLKIGSTNKKSRFLVIDDKFWDNLKCIVGYSEKFVIYRKKGRPTEIFHYGYLYDLVKMLSTANMLKNDKKVIVEDYLEELAIEHTKHISYLDKQSEEYLRSLFYEASDRDLLLMSYDSEGEFIRKDMHHLFNSL